MARLLISFWGFAAPVLLAGALAAGDAPEAISPPAPPPLPTQEPEAPATPEPPPPASPREFFNAGTRQLHSGKLREAEAFLEMALTRQKDSLQPHALYNLGLTRFAQGVEQGKKGPAPQPTLARGQAAAGETDLALRQANAALADDDVQRMVAAYLRGWGARRELKAATAAVRQALKVYGAVLQRWERAAGDFKSAFELNPAAADARHNAEVTDRHIARLVDSLNELQQCLSGLCGKESQLSAAMKKLKGRIPAADMPPGVAGEEEDDEEQTMGPQPGQQEGPSREGEEMHLSPEQAGWLLEAYKLDTERRLPMGQESTSEPRDRSRPAW